MSSYDFWVEGRPIAQPRPRMTKGGHVYTPEGKVRPWKEAIAAACRAKMDRPFQGGVRVHLRFLMPLTKLEAKKKPADRVPHCKKPDIDNLTKAVLDAIQKIAFGDDAQVAFFSADKVICAHGDEPGVQVFLEGRHDEFDSCGM